MDALVAVNRIVLCIQTTHTIEISFTLLARLTYLATIFAFRFSYTPSSVTSPHITQLASISTYVCFFFFSADDLVHHCIPVARLKQNSIVSVSFAYVCLSWPCELHSLVYDVNLSSNKLTRRALFISGAANSFFFRISANHTKPWNRQFWWVRQSERRAQSRCLRTPSTQSIMNLKNTPKV